MEISQNLVGKFIINLALLLICCSLLLPMVEAVDQPVTVSRILPANSVEQGQVFTVELILTVEEKDKPASLIITDQFSSQFEVVEAGRGLVSEGSVKWLLIGLSGYPDVASQTLSYQLKAPTTDEYYAFNGVASYGDITQEIEGDRTLMVGCVEQWNCSDWSQCSQGTRTRQCEDLNACGTTDNQPKLVEECSGGEETEQQQVNEQEDETTETTTLGADDTEEEETSSGDVDSHQSQETESNVTQDSNQTEGNLTNTSEEQVVEEEQGTTDTVSKEDNKSQEEKVNLEENERNEKNEQDPNQSGATGFSLLSPSLINLVLIGIILVSVFVLISKLSQS